MSEAFPPGTVDVESVPGPALRYSFCSLVTDIALYREMVASFREKGFSEAACEFLYVDNTAGNRFDAYAGLNVLIARARGEFLVLCHQDILAYDDIALLDARLQELTARDPDWGVAGNAGYGPDGRMPIQCITDIGGYKRHAGDFPEEVISLDENFIIARRSTNPGLSADLHGFHMYGPDMVVQAALAGRKAYVIGFHVEHRGHAVTGPSFVRSARAFEDKYARALTPRRVRTTVTKSAIGASWLARAIRDFRRNRRFNRPEDVLPRRFKLRKLAYVLHERLHGPVYRIGGHAFALPPGSNYALQRGVDTAEYERPMREFVASHLPEGVDVVELGGGFGIVSPFIRDRIGPDARHVIVEAHEALAPYLNRNTDLKRNAGKTTLVTAAIAYEGKPQVDFLLRPLMTMSRLARGADDGPVVPVPAKTLSQVLEETGVQGPYALVCDIEGTEFDVFECDSAALRDCVCVIVEINPRFFHDRGRTVRDWLNLFHEAGFEIVDEDTNVIVGRKPRPTAN